MQRNTKINDSQDCERFSVCLTGDYKYSGARLSKNTDHGAVKFINGCQNTQAAGKNLGINHSMPFQAGESKHPNSILQPVEENLGGYGALGPGSAAAKSYHDIK